MRRPSTRRNSPTLKSGQTDFKEEAAKEGSDRRGNRKYSQTNAKRRDCFLNVGAAIS